MLGRMNRACEHLGVALGVGSGAAVLGLVVLVSYSAISRYAFGNPVNYMEEVAGLFLMVAAFLSLPLVFVRRGHIRITLLLGRLPQTARNYVEILARVALVFYLALFTKLSYHFVVVSYHLDCHTHDARLYEVPWMAVMPVTGALFFVVGIVSLITRVHTIVRGGTSPLEGTDQVEGIS